MKDKGQEKQQRIVAAANQLFYERGFNQTSFSDIAEAADVPRGNFYYYFKSKDDILAAVIETRLQNLRDLLAGWDVEFPAPRDRIKRFLNMPINDIDEVMRYGCPLGTLNVELSKTQVDLQAKAKESFDILLDWLERQFAAMGYGSRARGMAMSLMGRAQGTLMMSNLYMDADFLRHEVEEARRWIDSLPASV